MKWLKRLRQIIRGLSQAHKFLYHPYLKLMFYLPTAYHQEWIGRINDVINCPESKLIKRVPQAGKIINGYQLMHNGLKVIKDSYYAYPITKMLILNKGVHEPQEEYAFSKVLKYIPKNSTMIELGAYWGFYSMWFNKEIKGARNFLIEPEPVNLDYGRKNFSLNKMRGLFYQGYIGKVNKISEDGTKIFSVDNFSESQNIKFIYILHADIQGFELEMLNGAREMLAKKKVGYIFISSHTEKLHRYCIDELAKFKYQIVADFSPKESFSADGLIVAKKINFPGPRKIKLSKKLE